MFQRRRTVWLSSIRNSSNTFSRRGFSRWRGWTMWAGWGRAEGVEHGHKPAGADVVEDEVARKLEDARAAARGRHGGFGRLERERAASGRRHVPPLDVEPPGLGAAGARRGSAGRRGGPDRRDARGGPRAPDRPGRRRSSAATGRRDGRQCRVRAADRPEGRRRAAGRRNGDLGAREDFQFDPGCRATKSGSAGTTMQSARCRAEALDAQQAARAALRRADVVFKFVDIGHDLARAVEIARAILGQPQPQVVRFQKLHAEMAFEVGHDGGGGTPGKAEVGRRGCQAAKFGDPRNRRMARKWSIDCPRKSESETSMPVFAGKEKRCIPPGHSPVRLHTN